MAILAVVRAGMFTVVGGCCAGTEPSLAVPNLVGTVTADTNGEESPRVTAPAQACGRFLQAGDVTTCTPTNVAQVP